MKNICRTSSANSSYVRKKKKSFPLLKKFYELISVQFCLSPMLQHVSRFVIKQLDGLAQPWCYLFSKRSSTSTWKNKFSCWTWTLLSALKWYFSEKWRTSEPLNVVCPLYRVLSVAAEWGRCTVPLITTCWPSSQVPMLVHSWWAAEW